MSKTFNLKSFVISTLRRASYRWIPRNEALKHARIARNQYLCAQCKKVFTRKEVKIDHIEPIVPLTGWISYDSLIMRLYCEEIGFQILCNEDHLSKTRQENTIRRQNKVRY